MLMQRPSVRKKQSVRIPKEVLQSLKKWYKTFHTKTDAAWEAKVDYRVIDKALLSGTCSPDTLEKLEQLFKTETTVA